MIDRLQKMMEEAATLSLEEVIFEALQVDGEHHKQWWLEVIALKVVDLKVIAEYDYIHGIAP